MCERDRMIVGSLGLQKVRGIGTRNSFKVLGFPTAEVSAAVTRSWVWAAMTEVVEIMGSRDQSLATIECQTCRLGDH